MPDSTSHSPLNILASMLQDLGYRGVADEEHNVVATSAGGFTTTITLSTGSDVQLRCFVVGVERPIGLVDLNTFNQRYRFAKTYVDDDGDYFLEADFFFDEGSPDSAEKLGDIMRLWEHLVSSFKDLLFSTSGQAERASAPR